ncbi:MAG TPA: tetratricopeptide repeat protein [Polyangiaceae bacterium]|jgi:hypothetical protein|nr:tetratricopeptide repeat protein [Polyangiaceae bacterium]
MSDPERWLRGTEDGDALERDLLASLRSVRPPEGAKEAAWEGMAAQLAGAALVGTAAATGLRGVALALKASATKIVLGVALAGAAVGGAAVYVHARATSAAEKGAAAESAPRVEARRAGAAPVGEPAVSVPSIGVPPADAQRAAPDPAPPARPAERARPDRLGAESALLTQARAELRRGDLDAAQATLARMQAAFPNGVLGQEREVLAIEVLAAGGKTDAAKRRARAFIEAHPESPHRTKLGRLLDEP